MSENFLQDVYIPLGGQDDNLGDSALRAAYFRAAQGAGRRFHVQLGERRTTDYLSGLPLRPEDLLYRTDDSWIKASKNTSRAVLLYYAGEVTPRGGIYPHRHTAIQLQKVLENGGTLIVAGTGLKDPSAVDESTFHPILREASVVSWRDRPSRDAAGFGGVAPDWAYSLGTETTDWTSPESRRLLAVSLRYDRPWPDEEWLQAVRDLAAATSTRIVTLAQVARDAPRSALLAESLGGEYLVPHSMSHADLDAHARDVYGRSLAVISDRAHGLIIGATEGACPIGSAADPQKIERLLAAAGLGELVGRYDQLAEFGERLESQLPTVAPAIDGARAELADLALRIDVAMKASL
ncbi:hypothetical protein [Nesterenkonia sp. F]|uniref:hypothetical protein n=1 Tax=Nesterenkonia sp. F TaxID=795955 RepID=UPI001111B633|nr:hypothetical protein [Nesterenkonia sp. F]